MNDEEQIQIQNSTSQSSQLFRLLFVVMLGSLIGAGAAILFKLYA